MVIHGGKGSGLIWLSQNTDLGFRVPKFDFIDHHLHEELLKYIEFGRVLRFVRARQEPQVVINKLQVPRRLEERCRELAEKFRGSKEIAVRSSGLASEDSEKHSGAGIYETTFIPGSKLTPESLLRAVLFVYDSAKSPRAVQYRKEIGLEQEFLEVIVQEAVPEFDGRFFGVMQSRLENNGNIIPITLSETRGAAVRQIPNAEILKIYYAKRKWARKKDYGLMFITDNEGRKISRWDASEALRIFFIPLIQKMRERYGREFKAEFVFDPRNPQQDMNLVQIRPLTGISDIEIEFPDKKPIFVSDFCIGAGEYIGPLVKKEDISGFPQNQPSHYVYVGFNLPQTIARTHRAVKVKGYVDYDEITSNKRAIILAGTYPGDHALTIANERGLLFLGSMEPYGSERKRYFNVKYSGKYIHIVINGVEGRAYKATQEEAVEFARKNNLPVPD